MIKTHWDLKHPTDETTCHLTGSSVPAPVLAPLDIAQRLGAMINSTDSFLLTASEKAKLSRTTQDSMQRIDNLFTPLRPEFEKHQTELFSEKREINAIEPQRALASAPGAAASVSPSDGSALDPQNSGDREITSAEPAPHASASPPSSVSAASGSGTASPPARPPHSAAP